MALIAWTDASLRYPELDKLPNITSSSVQSAYIAHGEALVNGRLGSVFTTPFSSNNLTAQSLCIDAIFVQTQLSRQPDKAKEILDYMDGICKRLLDGSAGMVTVGGTLIPIPASEMWSNTAAYHPTFGMGAPEVSAIDSSQLIAEDYARGGTGEAV